MEKAYRIDENGCWIWHNAKTRAPYRTVFEFIFGPVPQVPRHVIHHTCENARCVNPDHLVAVTIAEHSRIHHAWDKERGIFRSEIGRPGHRKTLEHRQRIGAAIRAQLATLTPEQRSARAMKAWETKKRRAEEAKRAYLG